MVLHLCEERLTNKDKLPNICSGAEIENLCRETAMILISEHILSNHFSYRLF